MPKPGEVAIIGLGAQGDGAAGGIILVVEHGLGRDAAPGWAAHPGKTRVDQHLVMIADLAIVGDAAIGDVAAFDGGRRARAPVAGETLEPGRERRVRIRWRGRGNADRGNPGRCAGES